MTGEAALLAAAAAAALCGWACCAQRPPAAADGRRAAAGFARFGGMPGRLVARRRPVLVAELVSGLSAELSAGQPLAAALEQAARGLRPDPCPRARRAARTGGDVAAALLVDARAPGGHDLVALAACWEVAHRSGAGLAGALDRLGQGLRASEQARAQLDGEVAAVRASARLLAALPVVGLLIGQMIGADPLGWLTGSWSGRATLAVGLGLQGLGLVWLRRLVARARRTL